MVTSEYSDLKIVHHPEKIKSLLEGKTTVPIHVMFNPTNRCNHSCFYCVYNADFSGIHEDMDRRDEISFDKMLKILSDFKEMGVKAVTFSGGGEPLIYPKIEKVLEIVISYGIKFAMITNGQELKGRTAELLANANWVRISSDSCDAETFSSIRNKPKEWFDILTENIRSFAKIKKSTCNLGINFVVHEKNKDKIYECVKFYKELGVNNIKFTPIWNQKFFEYHKNSKERVIEQIKRAKEDFSDDRFKVIDTYEKDFELVGVSERTYNKCFVMQINPVIGADCNVYFCHDKAYSMSGCLGSIKDKSFKELWFSKESAETFKKFNSKESCKHRCTNDKKNILIADILNSYGRDVDFI